MGKHFSHLTPTQRTQIDAFRRAGMKVVDIAKEVGVHYRHLLHAFLFSRLDVHL